MINTPHLEIKPFTLDDAEAFLQLSQDDGFNLFPINNYRQANLATSLEWIKAAMNLNQKTGMGKWGVWEVSSKNLIGIGGLTPWVWDHEDLVDITYRLRESAWGKGYGLELAAALWAFGFNQLGLKEITATITPDNMASKKIAHKLGMNFDQTIELLGVETELYKLKRSF